MEFDTEGLSRFILYLFTGHPMDVEDSDIEEVDISGLPNIDRLETRNNIDHDDNDDDEDDEVNKKQYCFIVFNSPKLSKLLKTKVLKKPGNTNQQGQRQVHGEHNGVARPARKPVTQQGEKEMDLNLHFSGKIETLINAFMEHQTPPFSRKYVLDLTDR
ncbi:unnamed protein product [Rotaria magnacalcarata]|uniref:Uncharacterized protein n=3 Tax=Rotaria TaxID=231623 RepID=A0A815ZP12_9BILA|nr:unnamed protein product [Rotaria magnacalcarata]CAF4419090.1 unnamed protein product [Rotaria magnacalcarata]